MNLKIYSTLKKEAKKGQYRRPDDSCLEADYHCCQHGHVDYDKQYESMMEEEGKEDDQMSPEEIRAQIAKEQVGVAPPGLKK